MFSVICSLEMNLIAIWLNLIEHKRFRKQLGLIPKLETNLTDCLVIMCLYVDR